jgi:hypothetical protein
VTSVKHVILMHQTLAHTSGKGVAAALTTSNVELRSLMSDRAAVHTRSMSGTPYETLMAMSSCNLAASWWLRTPSFP